MSCFEVFLCTFYIIFIKVEGSDAKNELKKGENGVKIDKKLSKMYIMNKK